MNNPIIDLLKHKIVLITASVFVVLLLIVIAINSFRQDTGIPPIQTPTDNAHILSPTPYAIPTIPVSNNFDISGVTVKNFYKSGSEINSTNDVLLFENIDYSISYTPLYQQFVVTIWSPKFLQIRTQIEQRLLSIIGISPADACKLNVQESIPVRVESPYAGGAYNLSFCEDR